MEIRVLHVVLSLGTGGLENGIVNTINGSEQKRFKIDVVCLRELGELGDRVNNTNTQVFFEPSLSSGLANAIKAIRKVHKKNRYHIIHTHGWATMLAGYLAGKLEGDTLVINGEHGTLYYKSLLQRLAQRFLFNQMKINLSVSAALVKEVSKKFGVSEDIFHPILNGVDVAKFKPLPEQRARVRQEWGIDDSTFIIGSVGRLVTVKNYPSLLRAFKEILENVSNAKLVFAGDGPNRAKLETLANDLQIADKVIFLGRREDVPAVMNGYDIFVLPSFREGLSNTILEAMASGLPAVVSNVGGSPEIVLHGETGHLFEVDNTNQIAGFIVDLLQDKKALEDMSKTAREHVVKNYSLQAMVNNYQAVYEKLVAENYKA